MKKGVLFSKFKINLGKHLMMLLTFIFVAAFSYGQTTYTWQGGGTTGSPGAWGTASNWFSSATSLTSLVVPGSSSTDVIVINNGCVQLSTNVTIAKLTVGNTASNQGIFNIASGSTLTVSGTTPVTITGGVLNNAGSLNITATTGNGISFSNTTGTTALLTSGTGYFGAGALSITVNTAGNFAVNFTNTNWASPTTVPTMTFNNPTISLPSSATSSLVNVAACSAGTTNGIIAGSGVTLSAGPYALITQLGAGSNTTGSGSNLTINSGCTLSCTGTTTTTSYGININNNWGGTSSTSANATLTNNGIINISGSYTIGVRMVSAIGSANSGLTKFTNGGTLNNNMTAGSGGAPITINASSSKYEIANSGTMNLTNLTASTAPITFASSQTGTLAFTNSGTITAIGGAAITANGTFASTSINNTGGTFTANYAPSGFASTTGNAIKNGITYVWGGATSLDYQVATNWTPNRVTSNISSSDIMQFSSSPAGTISNVPTQSIGQLIVSGSNTSVSLQAASSSSTTLTVGSLNNSGDEISVASGCTLSIAQNATGITSEIFTLALANISGVTGNIAGTLTIAKNTATTFANVYNAANGVTTVSGTVNYAGLINNATSGSLSFTNTSTFNNQRADAAFPAAFSSTYNRVNVSIATGLTQNTGQIPVSNFPASVNTLTVNDAGITGAAILNIRSISGGTGTSQTADITTLNVSSGRLGFGVNSTGVSTVNVGAGGINVSGGTLSLAYNNDQTVLVTGDIALSNSGIINISSTGTTNTATLTANNYTQTGSSTFNLSSSALATTIFNVKGNFSIAINGTFMQVSGANATLAFNSSSQAQTVSNAGTFSTLISKVQINNTNTSPNNTVSLSSTLSINGILQLTAGLLVLGGNNLTLTSAASLSPTTPTSTSYIVTNSTGKLIRQSVPASGNTIFPIGTTSRFAPLTFTGGTAGANITVGVSGTLTPSALVPNNVVNLQWSILASATTQPQVTFQYNSADAGSGYSSSGAVLGTYASGAYSESVLGTVSGSNPFNVTKTFSTDLPTTTASLYGIGNPYSFISGVPGAPTSVSAVAGNASAAVSFTAPSSVGASAISSYTVTSSPGGITASGASSPITVNGLTAGTAYTFTVVATNSTGNGTASTASSSVAPTGSYTWTGTTDNNYQTSTNWSPSRVTPSSFDVLQFSSNATVTNVKTETISRLVLSGTASVSIQPVSGTSTTLSVGKSHTNGVDEISVPSGCTLTLAGNASGGTEFITLGLASGVSGATASIAGTLTINPNATGTFLNTYNSANGVTTITGTVNYAGIFTSISGSSLLFSSGSTFINQRTDAAFPATANSNTYSNVNVQITNVTNNSGTVAIATFPASINTLTINSSGVVAPGILRVNSLSNAGSTITINTLNVQAGQFCFGSGITTANIISDLTVSGGRFSIANIGSLAVNVSGNLTLSSGDIYMLNAVATSSSFIGTLSVTGNYTQSNTGNFYLNAQTASGISSGTLSVSGNFSRTGTGVFSQTANSTGTLELNGTAAQTFSSTSFGAGIPQTFKVNNTGTSPNNTVTLSSSITSIGTLQMTSGLVVLGTFNITAASTSGGSSASYVNATSSGRLVINSVPSIGNTVFPVGTASSYAPLTFTGGTAGANITVGVRGSFTNSVLSPNNVVNLQWSILSNTSTTPTVTFQHNTIDRASGFTSTGAILGTYASSAYTESSLSSVSGGNPFSFTRTFISSLPTVTASLYGIGNPGAFAVTAPSLSLSNINKSFGDADFTVSATTNSSGAITYTSTNASVATVSGNTVSIVGVGSTTINVSLAANGGYTAATTSATLTVAAIVPGAPTNVVADEGNANASITFDAPTSNGGAIITGYTVTSNPGNISASGSTSPIVVNGLTNGTSYTFTVKATNSVGSSVASSASLAVIPTPTTIWDGISWSAGVPTSSSSVVIAGNYSTSSPLTVKLLTINSNVTVSTSSTISVTGSTFTNNGTISGGTVTLSGTTTQTISGTGTVNNITINNAAGATVTSGSNKLNITGILKLQSGLLTTNGNVVLKSTSITSSGILAPVGTSGNSGTITGNVVVERYIPNGYRGYRDIAPAVANAGSMFTNWQEAGASTSGTGIFITGEVGSIKGFNATTGIDYSSNGLNPASYYNNSVGSSNWTTITNTKTTTLDPYQPYRVLVRGDRSFSMFDTLHIAGINGNLNMVNATAIRATGKLITGNVVYSSTGVSNSVFNSSASKLNSSSTTAFSAVANPYVCPVDLTQVSATGIEGNGSINKFYYFDPTFSSTGTYVTVLNGVTTPSQSKATTILQAGQSIFVRNNASTTPTITFTESAKVTNTTQTAVFGVNNINRMDFTLLRKLPTDSIYSLTDGAVAVFKASNSNGYNSNEDAAKLNNANDNISIVNGNANLSIDGRALATATDSIVLKIASLSTKAYQLQVDGSSFTANGLTAYLYDAYLKSTTALTAGVNKVNFTVDNTIAATYTNRFGVMFKPTAPLSVKAIYASATLKNEIATINWNTQGEEKVATYTVEKSTDAKNFNKVGEAVVAKNSTTASYSATDKNIANGNTYYRIKATNIDGSIQYSNIAQLKKANMEATYSLYPNPLKGKALTIQMNNVAAGKYTVIIYNALGQKVVNQVVAHEGGIANHAMNIGTQLSAGVYTVSILGSEGKVSETKLSVE